MGVKREDERVEIGWKLCCARKRYWWARPIKVILMVGEIVCTVKSET